MSADVESQILAAVLRDTRARIERQTPPAELRWSTCRGCAGLFLRRKGRHKVLCPDCSADELVGAHLSMATRSGPVYERAARAQLAYWTAEAERLGL